MTDPIRDTFPILCKLLSGSDVDRDIDSAIEFAQDGEKALREAFGANVFQKGQLMFLLAAALTNDLPIGPANELEANLSVIVGALGADAVRRAYREKLLVNDRNALEDVQYEIAVTARACPVLDPGSIELEKLLPNSPKNSDVFGTFKGAPVRIEVTVLHEQLPPAIHLELDDLLKAAKVTSGFRTSLRRLLSDREYTEWTCTLLELLHEAHLTSGGKDEEIDGITFTWRGGAYHCSQESSPFRSITFYSLDEFAGAVELREINYPVSEQSVTPKHAMEDNPNPPGVVTRANLPDRPNDVPVSTKVRQMLQGKLPRCEDGIINIVAFGNPLPMHDREVVSAVRGAEYVTVNAESAELVRDRKSPFVPSHFLSEDERNDFVESFRKMSAVWHIRLDRYARSHVILNPNASQPVPQEFVKAVSDSGQAAQQADRSATETKAIPRSNRKDNEEIGWSELARDFIRACGSIHEARHVVEKLERSGVSIEALQSEMEQFWSKLGHPQAGMVLISPSNDQLGMQFVIDCGGFHHAKTRLDKLFDDYRANYRRRWVSENAYFRWLYEGYPSGHDVRHWLEAEAEYERSGK